MSEEFVVEIGEGAGCRRALRGNLSAVALRLDFPDDCMMNQSIDCNHRHHRVAEDRIPLTEGLIGCYQETSTFITMGNEFKEDRGLHFRLLDIAQVIQHQEVKAVELHQTRWQLQLVLVLL